MKFEVYCDENRPDLFSSEQPPAQYMVIGSLWLRSEDREKFKNEIHQLRDRHKIGGEFKWQKVSHSRASFYKDVIDWFCNKGGNLRFRCIAVDHAQVDLVRYHENDQELGFYKLACRVWLRGRVQEVSVQEYRKEEKMFAKNSVVCGLVLSVAIIFCVAGLAESGNVDSRMKYEPTWESLSKYEAPEWFKDAKFGIFIHWGVYAVPAYRSEWYPREMYLKNKDTYNHHKAVWGDQSKFGYKDFIAMFKAEKWDPAEWAELFRKAGATFVVPVAEHHDGFAMYNSSHTRWNSVQMGPHRDVVGELGKAVRARGMKLGASTHYAFNWKYYTHSDEFDTNNAAYFGLYGKPHDPKAPASKEFIEHWYARVVDIVHKYQPEVLWFDFGFNEPEFEHYRKKIGAYYYNKGLEWGRPVVLQYKNEAFPDGTAVLDLERGKLDQIRFMVWQTDTSISRKSWGYIENDEFKSVDSLVDDLVDIVSKNGVLLLNVGPKADGTIPDEAKEILLGIGKWLQVNGEAIYGTRPWHTYGEGPTKGQAGHMAERKGGFSPFVGEDIRFTTKDNTLYAICLDWPGKEATIKSVSTRTFLGRGGIADIQLLGARGSLKWSRDDTGLKVELPAERPCDYAYVLKISLKGELLGRMK
ncbi:MAG TPA: alpha-L-fucosidase [Sedimentisphaerales bacterium]|nr:alpha-L-fucosidase [Sedimentisphaerales bacterium]